MQPGDLTNVIETYTEQEEAQFVVKEIEASDGLPGRPSWENVR